MKPALLNFSGKIIQSLCNFLIVVQVSQVMGPEGRGVTALFGVVLAVALAVGEGGGGSALIFQLAHFKAGTLIKPASITLCLAALIVPLAFMLGGKFAAQYLIALIAAALVLLFYTLGLHLLLASRRMAWFSILQALPATALLVFLVFARQSLALTPMHYIWLYAAAYGLGFAGVWLLLMKHGIVIREQDLPPASILAALKPALLNQAGHLAALTNNRLVFLIFPAVAMGIYSNALALSEALLLGAGSAGQILYSRFAGKTGSARIWQRWLLLTVVITGLGAILLACLPAKFYSWLFGTEFGATKQFLPILLAAIVLYSVFLVLSYYFSSRGWFQLNFWCMLASLTIQVVTLAFFWVAGAQNLHSAALGYAAGAAALAGVSFLMFKKRTSI